MLLSTIMPLLSTKSDFIGPIDKWINWINIRTSYKENGKIKFLLQ